MDVENWKPGEARTMSATDASIFGHPIHSLRDLKAGEYTVQALLDRYETFHRADGHVLKLPTDRGEGRKWNRAPGNIYSKPQKLRLDATKSGRIALALTEEIPPILQPADTKYVKHIRIQSERLSKFWGRRVYLGAHVLLPEGFETHPEARYPLMVFHGHFPADVTGFRTEPPDPNLKPDYNERFRIHGYNRIEQEEAYRFYQTWTNASVPRFLVVEIQHATPFYDDSYAVNSANVGPYGDAINELIPEIENASGVSVRAGHGLSMAARPEDGKLWRQRFLSRPLQRGLCRLSGPNRFPRLHCGQHLRGQKRVSFIEGTHTRVPRPGHRDYRDLPTATMQQMNYYELALGTKSRSGQQFDIWEAVFSPVGNDGYPKRIFDKVTGDIDPRSLILARALRSASYHAARLGHSRTKVARQNPSLLRHAR
jgi:hypothetical protein